ncbi:hypothetical protein B0H13DRAFT_1859268 [Mycena leptocephala]|nr:hypothetical protein B0H13DRAFT_1859268 [Mycena leptocephala]
MSEAYHGDTETLFRNMVRINRQPEDSPSCWRNINDDGKKTCSGAATILKLILGIPVMLILEMPADWEGQKENQWSFPDHIRPLTAGAEAMHGVVYDIVGRVLTNGGHFKAIFTPDGKHVYSYDGDENGGCAILTPDVNLAGRIPPKSGWRTYAVIYHLRGGLRVHSIRFAAISTPAPPYTIPDVVGLDLPNITEMAGEDRFWLRNPWRTDILDFISSRRKPKRVRFVDPDGDESDFSDSQRPVKKRRSNLVLSDEESDLNPKSSDQSTSSSAENQDPDDTDDIDYEIDCRCGKKGSQDPAMVPELLVKYSPMSTIAGSGWWASFTLIPYSSPTLQIF